jgi:16S rRNA A1518/A1519 N6-dimethyltransferase RsmA/KsgA/DIM1 with predicted DNA glycosylase/AP lyase activity
VLRTVRGISPSEAAAMLDESGIDTSARPEVLSPRDFVRLFKRVSAT